MSALNNRECRPTYETSLVDFAGATCAVCGFTPKRADGSDAPFVKFDQPFRLVCQFCVDSITTCVKAAKAAAAAL